MERERAMPGTENDESVLDRVEDALVGDHEEGAPAGSRDPDDREEGEKPFLKSP